MVIGICEMELRLGYVDSLKGKRSIIKSLIGRVQAKFNVSIAEVGLNDQHKAARIGMAYVSNDTAQAHRVLENVVSFIEGNFDVELVDYQIEMV